VSNPWTPHGLHGLTVLDDETIEWLLNTCPEIQCDQAVVRRTRSNELVRDCAMTMCQRAYRAGSLTIADTYRDIEDDTKKHN